MNRNVNEIRYFLFSQAFADGFRMTLGILLPSIVLSFFNAFETGLTISLGCLCLSLADQPGPFIHKKNGMLFGCVFVFFMTVLTIYATRNVYYIGGEIMMAAFFFSMFNVYGNRAVAAGNAGLLIMIFTMDRNIPASEAFYFGFLVLSGGLFYTFLSLLFYKLLPYRVPQRGLGEYIREMAKYLALKAQFYNTETDLDEDYKKLLNQQVVVNEKQDYVRELLFKTRRILNESSAMGRKLVWTFVETVDLFENITAIYYDYSRLRQQFGKTGILENISAFIRQMAVELDNIGFSVQSNSSYHRTFNYETGFIELKKMIDQVNIPDSNKVILVKILVNVRKLLQGFSELNKYFEEKDILKTGIDHSRFITHQSLDPRLLWNNITFNSTVFKHALRVSIACIAGYMISKFIAYGHHSYWILMTIIFMLKPSFSLTKQRNIQRIIGTVAGGAIGILILVFLPDRKLELVLMIAFMIGTYSFVRINYLVTVICITPYVLILFKFLGIGFISLAKERIIDTVLGCAIAFAAGYFLFPEWESAQLKSYIQKMVKANIRYLSMISALLKGDDINIIDYKLARKEVYVSSANLSAAFQRMLSEPKSKQKNEKLVHQFVVLNLILLSNIASVGALLTSHEKKKYTPDLAGYMMKAARQLEDGLSLHGLKEKLNLDHSQIKEHATEYPDADQLQLKEQLIFICKLASDIKKTMETMNL